MYQDQALCLKADPSSKAQIRISASDWSWTWARHQSGTIEAGTCWHCRLSLVNYMAATVQTVIVQFCLCFEQREQRPESGGISWLRHSVGVIWGDFQFAIPTLKFIVSRSLKRQPEYNNINLMIAKLLFRSEIRLCSGVTTFADLLSQVRSLFPCIPSTPKLFYQDSEGDRITISTTQDIETLRVYSQGKTIKIEVLSPDTQEVACPKERNQELEEFEVISDEEQIAKDIIRDTLGHLYDRAVRRTLRQEEEMVQELARHHVHFIGQRALKNALKTLAKQEPPRDNSERKTPRSKSSANNKSSNVIEQLVDKKIKLLIPTLIEKVTKLVQMKSRRQSCDQCDKYKRLLDKAILLNSYDLCNEEEFDQLFVSPAERSFIRPKEC